MRGLVIGVVAVLAWAGTAAVPSAMAQEGVPVGGTTVYVGDFSTDDFSQWGQVQKEGVNTSASDFDGDEGLRLVGPDDGGHPDFANSARVMVADGDVPPFGGGERSELSADDAADVYEGDERWYEFSLKFDESFENPEGDWCILMQWHAGSGSPPLSLNVDNDGNLEVAGQRPENYYDQDIGPIVRGEWVDYVAHVRFSNDADEGFVEVHQDGELVVPQFAVRTMASDDNYLKMGLYRDGDETSTAVVHHAGLTVTAP